MKGPFFYALKRRIRVAFHRCAVATLSHVRLCTLLQVILARLELLASCSVLQTGVYASHFIVALFYNNFTFLIYTKGCSTRITQKVLGFSARIFSVTAFSAASAHILQSVGTSKSKMTFTLSSPMVIRKS